jgi:hypothetical protein
MKSKTIVLVLLLTVTAAAQQLQPGREHIAGAESLMGMVQTPAGYSVRVFVTRPENASGKLPVIFVAAWLSCDSTEAPKRPTDGFTQLLFDVAGRSGFATYRVDKPGTGESGGQAMKTCAISRVKLLALKQRFFRARNATAGKLPRTLSPSIFCHASAARRVPGSAGQASQPVCVRCCIDRWSGSHPGRRCRTPWAMDAKPSH